MRKFFAVVLVAFASTLTGFSPHPHVHPTTPANTPAEFQPYIEYLAEFNNRRRANVYFANAQSIFNGVQVNFVNVGKGNATFVRRDLVAPGRMPIIAARLFDSSSSGSIDFGPGWALIIAERVELSDAGATVHTETGDAIQFVPHGTEYVLAQNHPSDYRKLTRSPGGTIIAALRTGIVKEFSLITGAYRLTSVTDHFGNGLTVHYEGGLISEVCNASHTVAFDRTSDGRVTKIHDDSGRSAGFIYDAKGRLTASLDLGGNRWNYDYSNSRLHTAVDPEGRLNFKFRYQPDGRVSAVELPSGKLTYDYDDASSITTVTDRKNLGTRYHQNAEGITTAIDNALGDTSVITLDAARNVAEITYNGAGIGAFQYNSDHQLIHRDGGYDGEDETADYSYSSGRLTKIAYSDGTQQSFTYRPDGMLAGATSREGAVTNYSSDGNGSLAEVLSPGRHIKLQYDADGLITSAKSDSSGFTFQYGKGARLTSVKPLAAVPSSKSLSLQTDSAVSMTYNALGLREDVSFTDGRGISYTFDAGANLRSATVKMANGTTDGERLILDDSYAVTRQVFADGTTADFKYDKNGNLTDAIADRGTTHYEYDNLDRLTTVVKSDGTRLQYAYAPGEPSLVSRAHSEYAGRWNANIDSGASFGSALAVYGTRAAPVSYGVVGVGSGAFIFAAGEYDEYVSPVATAELPLHNLRLEHLQVGEEKDFYAPSNVFFLPAEYATLNCCICPGNEAPSSDQPCMRCYPDPPPEPYISSISPTVGLVGQTVRVTVNGSYFGTTGHTSSSSEIDVTIVSWTSTRIVADFAIHNETGAGGSYGVTVANVNGTSNAKTFFVQYPASMLVVAANAIALNTPGAQCGKGRSYGMQVAVRYAVVDQVGGAILSSQLEPQEKVTGDVLHSNGNTYLISGVPTPTDIAPDLGWSSSFTDSTGQFVDSPLGACNFDDSSQPTWGPYDESFTQTIFVGVNLNSQNSHLYTVRTQQVTDSSSAAGHGSLQNNLGDIRASR